MNGARENRIKVQKHNEGLSSWSLFKLRGVEIKVHVSLLFLLFYVIIVAMVQFPFVLEFSNVNPADIQGTPFVWAVIFAFSLIISIFIHEFGHILVAQARGHKVRSMTLMMLGGVSHLERIPQKPLDEFKIAIIGPVVSLAIGGVLFGIRHVSQIAAVDLFCYWIGQANIVLGIFNLLPAFPTDGGRILRSILVTKKGMLRGTEIAVKVSHALAFILGLIGLFQFNFLLILIAFFIYGAAKTELLILKSQTLLRGLFVQDIMVNVPSVPASASIADAVQEMIQSKNVVLPVVDAEGIFSTITAEQISQVPQNLWKSTPLKNIISSVIKTVRLEDALDEVFLMALSTPGGHLPVVEDNHLRGVLPLDELTKTIQLRQLIQERPSSKPWSFKMRQAHSRS